MTSGMAQTKKTVQHPPLSGLYILRIFQKDIHGAGGLARYRVCILTPQVHMHLAVALCGAADW